MLPVPELIIRLYDIAFDVEPLFACEYCGERFKAGDIIYPTGTARARCNRCSVGLYRAVVREDGSVRWAGGSVLNMRVFF